MGTIIGICNQKGGTGKTTTAINLSSYLALRGKKTLLIDMDPQGNASSGLGVNPEGKNSVYKLISGEVLPGQAIYPTEWPNLALVPADISLTGGEVELVTVNQRETLLYERVRELTSQYDYLIIDAPPSLGLLTLNVLVAANSLLIPVQCEYYALEGVSKLVNTVSLVKERFNRKLAIGGVLLTMADFRTRLTLQVIEEVRNYFKQETFSVIVPRNVRLAEAPSFGKPIHFYDSNCVGAKAYSNLADEVIGRREKAAQFQKVTTVFEELS